MMPALLRYPARLGAHLVAVAALETAFALARALHACGVHPEAQKQVCWPLITLGCAAASVF